MSGQQNDKVKVRIPIVVAKNGRMSGYVSRNPDGTQHEDVGLCEEDIIMANASEEDGSMPYRIVYVTAEIDLSELFKGTEIDADATRYAEQKVDEQAAREAGKEGE